MQVAILTVGNELLAGDIENTNATWLARRLTGGGLTEGESTSDASSDGGAEVTRIQTVPDDHAVIAEVVAEWSDAFDAVIVTGGLGGTPDDITMEAVAAGLDREFVLNDEAAEQVQTTIEAILERRPDIDFELDVAWYASMPEGSEVLPNSEGLAPGSRTENVYVLPGIPEEMKPMFESIAERFAGDRQAKSWYANVPEGAMTEILSEAQDRFAVEVGSYPNRGGPMRIKLTAADEGVLTEASEWLRATIEIPLFDTEKAARDAAENA